MFVFRCAYLNMPKCLYLGVFKMPECLYLGVFVQVCLSVLYFNMFKYAECI